MALTGPQKTNITAVESALNTALSSLPSTTADTDQAAAREVLRSVQARLRDHLTEIRARS